MVTPNPIEHPVADEDAARHRDWRRDQRCNLIGNCWVVYESINRCGRDQSEPIPGLAVCLADRLSTLKSEISHQAVRLKFPP